MNVRETEKVAANLLISGKVQGVGYRFWTLQQAKKLGIVGWVKNLPDSRVEAVLMGNHSSIETMVKLCESGPPPAKVDNISVSWIKYEEMKEFEIRY